MRSQLFPIACATLVFLAACGARADEPPSSPAVTILPADTRLQPLRREITDAVADASPVSISIAVAHRGEIVWQEAFGWADLAGRIRATPATSYPIASVSKPFTATALLVLAERGLVDLARPANDYLGIGKIAGQAADARTATLRLILQHRAGLAEENRYYFDFDRKVRPSLDETIARYAVIVRRPDQQHDYSNLGYGVVERVIELISRKSFAEFMRSEVFLPLGLGDTAVGPMRHTAATLYGPGNAALPRYDFDARGSGTLHSTARDLVRFGMFHLKERVPGQRAILDDAAIDEMLTDRRSSGSATGFWGPDWFYALGWGGREETEHGHLWYGHEGGSPGVSAILRMAPRHRLVVAVLANSREDLTYSLADSVLDALIDDYAERRKRDPTWNRRPPAPEAFVAPAELIGSWRGELATWKGPVPVWLRFEAGAASARIGDSPQATATRLARADDRVSGWLETTIPNPDTDGVAHAVRFRLWHSEGKLQGEFAAAASGPLYPIWLPFWASLVRDEE